MRSKLKEYVIDTFKDGYNSYSGSKTLVKKTEIPSGMNVTTDDNGSMTKRAGYSIFGGLIKDTNEIGDGYKPMGIAEFKTADKHELIIAAGNMWLKRNPNNTWTALNNRVTMPFTPDKPTFFVQAMGRLYGCNGVDPLRYYDGTSVVTVTDFGDSTGIFDKIEYAYQRLWGIQTSDKGKLWYSNPIADDGTMGDFGTFSVDLEANPVKNAGFIEPRKGAGTEIVDIREDGGFLWIMDKRRVRKLAAPTDNVNKTVSFPVDVVASDLGGASPRGSVKTLNDFWLYSGENLYTSGEVAQYTSPRTTPKSGRIRSEIESISPTGKPSVALGYFKEKIYVSYRQGSVNDRIIVLDTRLNAWSSPYTGINVSAFLVFEENGIQRLLGISSNDNYIYELETGTDDAGQEINSFFETISTDCDMPGRIKRVAFIDVFYGMLYGTLSYEVFIDETLAITGKRQIGTSTTSPSGIGTKPIGTYPLGQEYDPNTEYADLRQNDVFRIECDYEPSKRLSVRFTNNESGEQFKINGIIIYVLPGDIRE